LIVSIFWAGVAFGRFFATLVSKNIRAEYLLIATISIIGVSAGVLLMFSSNTLIGAMSAFAVGFGCGPVFPTTLAIVSDTYPRIYTVSSGVIIAIGNVGAMIIPWLQGQVGRGENGGMIVTVTTALLMIVLAVYISRQVSQNQDKLNARGESKWQ